MKRQATIYRSMVPQLLTEIAKTPEGIYKTKEEIFNLAKSFVEHFSMHFIDKNKQTMDDEEILEIFTAMEAKWRELGGDGDFPRPDKPGTWSDSYIVLEDTEGV